MPTHHNCREELHEAGSKATPGRLALLKVLERAPESLTVKELEIKLPELNHVTLYRALEALVEAGLVRKGIREGVMRFAHAEKPHHHHLVCTDCEYEQACRTC